MNPSEFTRLADATRLKPAGREMARRVLVDGIRPAEVARQLAVADATVRAKCAIIIRELHREQGAPAHWLAVTVLVPPDGVAAVLSAAERARRPGA